MYVYICTHKHMHTLKNIWLHTYIHVCLPTYISTHIQYICHRHGIWVKEKMERFGCIYSIWGFWFGCWQMHRWMTMLPMCMHSGFPTGRSKQMIVMSLNDVTRISNATLGGNYKRRAHWNLGAVIWVFWY